jgi:hypothetical protein
METQDIILYKDFNYSVKWNDFTYKVEFNGNKARVISSEPFSKNTKSRFNKLIRCGKTTIGNHYCLTVNGQKVFFISTYNIKL